ncbi:hypothetical protein HCU01_10950 [Halomonas cupida]|uniref:HicA toxin of toxin-antitoxin n=1 Tax=Halomonas cupida TaxID=44933 RepID=A0A1M7DF16_9GAMM|nr:hypothetical protein [Halomonas cupida]GEN23146.1 hypothetical protein HCU01_10950 [Halomonas cupida]SHL77998.1 hypothetical protein SAMN05660971_01312 [Halomonas cupida]
MAKQYGKGVQKVVRFAEAHNWHIERTRGGHIKLTKPGMPPVFTSYSPSDARSQRNAIALLRRVQRSSGVRRES